MSNPYNPYGPSQAPPPQQWPGYQPPPPRRRHTFRNVVLSMLGVLVIFIALGAVLSSGTTPAAPAAATGASTGGGASPAAAAPAPRPAAKRHTVTYIVTGSPADVTYGPTGTDLSGRVPMHVTRRLGHPQYYSISAQLQGSGTVRCAIRVNGKVISKATATGPYNIADCEISQDPFSGDWQDTNSG